MNVGYKTEIDLLKEEKIAVLEDKSSNSTKYVVWHIEGGLGKNVAATALVAAVKQKYKDRKLILVVSYPEVFLNHPDIHRVYRGGMVSYFYDDYIKDKDTNINAEFINRKISDNLLLESPLEKIGMNTNEKESNTSDVAGII